MNSRHEKNKSQHAESRILNPLNGWINLNKPLGITSADAVNKAKWLIKPSKIGHAGTLDPLATGVLPMALGEGTKCINLLMDAKKTYEFSVTFGETRSTDDAEGEVLETSSHIPTESQLREILPRFTGAISQMPPIYSALKVAGKRAYDLARAGEEVKLAPRIVTIHALDFIAFTSQTTATFFATVSKGTYIRSLGRDMAAACGSCGYISRLHRSAVGPFTDRDAISLDFLEKSVHKAQPSEGNSFWLIPLERALDDIPALSLEEGQLTQLRHGQPVGLANHYPDTPQLGLLYRGTLVGLARVEGNRLISNRLLVRDSNE